MKFVKKFSYLIVGMLLCFSLAIPAFATDCTASSYSEFFDASEFEEVQKAVLNSDFLYENGVLNGTRATSDGGSQLGASYKVHTLTQPDLVMALQSGEDMSNIISNDYIWIVPTSENESIRVDDAKGEWEVIGYSTPASSNATTDLIQIDTLNAEISTFGTDVGKVSEVVCFEAPMYHTNFVYMKAAEDEALIPYGSRPDLTGLENGKPYSLQEVSDILAVSFDGIYSPDENAGTGTQSTDVTTMVLLSVVALSALACGVVYVIRKRMAH
jgi:hypothetical protein